ncbi:MAG: 50S ribosomal protein L1 [Candidatus Levybacteria bacterium]|nr:50S ribosomal protein L1 [Candidatus Levybacteria bacterium]
MGKIRIKTIGDEAAEAEQKTEQAKRKAQKFSEAKSAFGGKKEAKMAKKTHLPGMEGGQRISVVGPTEEELAKLSSQTESPQPPQSSQSRTLPEASSQKPAAAKPRKSKFKKARSRSSNYTAKVMEVDKNKTYSLAQALELLKKVNLAKFDETVELHINTKEPGINGRVVLPHGTGKELRIAIANDEILAEVEKGKINFDVLIAAPSMMPKLARVAKILGPKGLMPNPKNGTISENPQEAMKKFQGGQISFKTESKIPLMHLVVGKMSFGEEKLSENIIALISAIKKDRITKVTLKSTMSPSIKLQV